MGGIWGMTRYYGTGDMTSVNAEFVTVRDDSIYAEAHEPKDVFKMLKDRADNESKILFNVRIQPFV
jgi:hypothetical protein